MTTTEIPNGFAEEKIRKVALNNDSSPPRYSISNTQYIKMRHHLQKVINFTKRISSQYHICSTDQRPVFSKAQIIP